MKTFFIDKFLVLVFSIFISKLNVNALENGRSGGKDGNRFSGCYSSSAELCRNVILKKWNMWN